MSVLEIPQNPTLEVDEAADGRFFVPTEQVNPESFYKETNLFCVCNEDLIVGDVSDVLQETTPNGSGMLGSPTTSLLFDARERDQGSYMWEVTRAGDDGRYISRLTVTPFRFQMHAFDLDSQGRLASQREETEEGVILEAVQEILRMLHGDTMKTNLAEIRERAQRAREHLADFSIFGRIAHSYEVEVGDKKVRIKRIGKLVGEIYNKELKRRTEQAETIGFVKAKLYAPFNGPMQPTLPLSGNGAVMVKNRAGTRSNYGRFDESVQGQLFEIA